jgi:hypothetical protein
MGIYKEFHKKGYLLLIEEVKKIDKEAALYLDNEARNIEGFNESMNLLECFDWGLSSQGHSFWSRIHDDLVIRNFNEP